MENERLIGENLYAKHSIEYKFDSIEDSFQVFALVCDGFFEPWSDIEEFCLWNGLKHVEVIYKGVYDKDKIMEAFENKKKELAEQGQDIEGFVVRNAKAFYYKDFQKNVAKFVRANHVQADKHWRETWTKNEF